MAKLFDEETVHDHLYKVGLAATIASCQEVENFDPEAEFDNFELWRIIKSQAMGKIKRLHQCMQYGEFLATKLKLPIDKTKPMELDLFGCHEDGLFVLELKVDRAAERNAFSELLGYSYYIAEMYALSGAKDITNVLVANLDAKITRQAYLYDLLISDRDVIVYKPTFPDGTLASLRLELHVPSDDDFKHLTNELLSHDSMACIVVSFDDLEGWFDNEEDNGSLNSWTKSHLEKLANYTAQLMEADRLHGFCFIRKHWQEVPLSCRSSIIICALNPFNIANLERSNPINEQISQDDALRIVEAPRMGFYGRLIRLGQRTIKDCFTHDYRNEIETPHWSGMITSMVEVVFTHNFGFRPVGMLREAYTSHLNNLYAHEANGTGDGEDVSTLKLNEITNWMRAWMFMEACGFAAGEMVELDDADDNDDDVP
ncbi:MAG: hypothetical protein WC803_07380 [Sphingomonas sp.]|jgi:hypothetical protein